MAISRSWRRSVMTLCGALALWSSFSVLADEDEEKVTDGHRTHYVISDAAGAVLGRATIVPRWTESWNRTVVTFESESGDRLLLENVTDYEARTTEWRIGDLRGDDWIALRIPLPFSGKTQSEAFAEADATRMQIFRLGRDELEFETKAGKWQGSEAAWQGEGRVTLTRDLRRSISFELLETIERVADVVFAIGPAHGERLIFEYLLYRPLCASDKVRAVEAVPDCTFDARLGFPCSEKQLERASKAADPNAEWLMY